MPSSTENLQVISNHLKQEYAHMFGHTLSKASHSAVIAIECSNLNFDDIIESGIIKVRIDKYRIYR